MSVNTLMRDLTYLSPVVLLAGLILGLISYGRNPAVGKLIFWYICASLCLDIASRYWGETMKNNLVFFSFSGLLDLLFFTLLYTLYFRFSYRMVVWIVSVLTGAMVVGNMLFYKKHILVTDFHAYDRLVCDGVIFIYALASMFDLLRGKGELKQEIIRVNVVVLLYFSLDMLISLSMNFLVNAGLHFVTYFWFLRLALLLTLYITLIYTLWQTGKNRKRLRYG